MDEEEFRKAAEENPNLFFKSLLAAIAAPLFAILGAIIMGIAIISNIDSANVELYYFYLTSACFIVAYFIKDWQFEQLYSGVTRLIEMDESNKKE